MYKNSLFQPYSFGGNMYPEWYKFMLVVSVANFVFHTMALITEPQKWKKALLFFLSYDLVLVLIASLRGDQFVVQMGASMAAIRIAESLFNSFALKKGWM